MTRGNFPAGESQGEVNGEGSLVEADIWALQLGCDTAFEPGQVIAEQRFHIIGIFHIPVYIFLPCWFPSSRDCETYSSKQQLCCIYGKLEPGNQR